MSGWQSIDTAPKTGLTIWLGSDISDAMIPGWWVDGFGWASDHIPFDPEFPDGPEFEEPPFEPTHWHQYFPDKPVGGSA